MRRQLRSAQGVRASSRDLAKACKLARSKVVPALDSLSQRCIITLRQGTATSAATYRVNIAEIVTIGGPQGGPPQPNQWSPKETTQVPMWDHPGPLAGCGKRDSGPLKSASVERRINNLQRLVNAKKGFFRNLLEPVFW